MPPKKSLGGEAAFNPEGLVQQAVCAIKSMAPTLGVITDVALDPYTSHGQDGIVRDGVIANDETVEVLVKQALSHIHAGADVVCAFRYDGRASGRDSQGF